MVIFHSSVLMGFSWIFPYKPSILGYPMTMEHHPGPWQPLSAAVAKAWARPWPQPSAPRGASWRPSPGADTTTAWAIRWTETDGFHDGKKSGFDMMKNHEKWGWKTITREGLTVKNEAFTMRKWDCSRQEHGDFAPHFISLQLDTSTSEMRYVMCSRMLPTNKNTGKMRYVTNMSPNQSGSNKQPKQRKEGIILNMFLVDFMTLAGGNSNSRMGYHWAHKSLAHMISDNAVPLGLGCLGFTTIFHPNWCFCSRETHHFQDSWWFPFRHRGTPSHHPF